MTSHVFAGSLLDRVSHLRNDPEWVARALGDEASRFLCMWQLQVLVISGEARRLAWATSDVQEHAVETTGSVLLGVRDEVAHFAVDVSGLEKPEIALGVSGAAKFEDPRAAAAVLDSHDAAVLAHARSLVDWHATHTFCAACGDPTRTENAGTTRRCPSCGVEHFPRTNPVVITVVTRDDRCLLGRQPGWPTGMFSALAGFLEPGESLEEAVRREIMEEARIEVGDVHYHSSQPWPFPSSLMLGCIAEGLSEKIELDGDELADARWFPRELVRKAIESPDGSTGFWVPPPMSIAHQLLRAWALD